VENQEGTDLRDFHPPQRYEVVTCDVSFISLHHLLDDLDRVADGVILTLFKPQFEVGRQAARNRHGVVTDEEAIRDAMARFEAETVARGWRLMVKEASTVPGKEGNREWFYLFVNR
jgi:23S rRNA (cytidine1920-2'-O)/16S rRNA (cytidine1409-2'-O)-methyltransferase